MVHVSVIFPVADLEAAIAAGEVRVQTNGRLRIYNYTEETQFRKRWNNVTLNCRGLILDESYNIVARPWKKFFNLGEGYAEIDMTMPVEVTDKIDGSLGILYEDDAGPGIGKYLAIATRGSFNSDQAIHASRLFNFKYADKINYDCIDEYTFLFEIVYPENRIVVNYNGMDDLILLGAVNKAHGFYLGPNEAAARLNWPGPVTEVFSYRTMQEAFDNNQRPNAEGYVIRSGQSLVKLKQSDYLELHKIVTNLNERTVWEQISNGKTVDEICQPLPDEFHAWVAEVADDLFNKYRARMNEVVDEYNSIEPGLDRKSFAMIASKSKNAGYLFSLLDGKPIDSKIWSELKPAVNKE